LRNYILFTNKKENIISFIKSDEGLKKGVLGF